MHRELREAYDRWVETLLSGNEKRYLQASAAYGMALCASGYMTRLRVRREV